MEYNYLKYFKDIPLLFYCATPLDPAIGVDGVESLLEEINKNLGIYGEDEYEHFSTRTFNETLNALFQFYESLYQVLDRHLLSIYYIY